MFAMLSPFDGVEIDPAKTENIVSLHRPKNQEDFR